MADRRLTFVPRSTEAAGWQAAVRAAAAVVPLGICGVLAGFRDSVTAATSVLVLVLWTVAAAATGDRVAGLLAAASSGIWFDFFLTQPYLRFSITDREDVEATALLVLIGLAVTEVALWGQRQHAAASRRSGYLEGVLQAAGDIADRQVPATVTVDHVRRQITRVLGADDCRYVEGPLHDRRIGVLDHDGGLTRQGRAVDVERTGLPTDDYVAVLVRRGEQQVGHFLVTASTQVVRPTREQRRVAVLLADQVSAAVPAT